MEPRKGEWRLPLKLLDKIGLAVVMACWLAIAWTPLLSRWIYVPG